MLIVECPFDVGLRESSHFNGYVHGLSSLRLDLLQTLVKVQRWFD